MWDLLFIGHLKLNLSELEFARFEMISRDEGDVGDGYTSSEDDMSNTQAEIGSTNTSTHDLEEVG